MQRGIKRQSITELTCDDMIIFYLSGIGFLVSFSLDSSPVSLFIWVRCTVIKRSQLQNTFLQEKYDGSMMTNTFTHTCQFHELFSPCTLHNIVHNLLIRISLLYWGQMTQKTFWVKRVHIVISLNYTPYWIFLMRQTIIHYWIFT